jgi:hypothetical protein
MCSVGGSAHGMGVAVSERRDDCAPIGDVPRTLARAGERLIY